MNQEGVEKAFELVEKRWIAKNEASEEIVNSLNNIKGLNPIVARLLGQKGIKSEEELKKYFNPSLDDLHDPFLMLNMDRAVERLENAILNSETIMIFGDYDVDGTTSTALVFKYLNQKYSKLKCYIPDRYVEGYGISLKGIDTAAELGAKLIIALDCGIKALDKVEYASQLGIDFIICDHHQPGNEVPAAAAVLDPKQVDCQYPYKELSGCGVGFKFMQAMCLKMNWDLNSLFQMLDLVALSIASDIVPITGENRILTHFGLQQINSNPGAGIQALIEICGFKPRPDNTYDLKVDRLVFGLGPRINAAGRIGHGMGAVNLLISETLEEARNLVGQIDDQNLERKELDRSTTLEALDLILENENYHQCFSTVLFQPHWHKGVIGIVASRCIESFYRPTIILTESNGKLTGSGRSIFGLDLYETIDACSQHLIQFGGHYFAAGLTLLPEKLEDFKQEFENEVRKRLTEEDLIPRLVYDLEISLTDFSPNLLKQMNRMGPFGPQNQSPLFYTKGIIDTGNSRLLESKTGTTSHIKFEFPLPEGNSVNSQTCVLEGIGFGLGNFWPYLKKRQPFDILYHIEENDFRGVKKIQLAIKAIRISSVEAD